jgi:hypothetical protein
VSTAPPIPAALAIFDAIRSGSADPQKLVLNLLGAQSTDRPEASMLLNLLANNNSDDLREQLREELRQENAEAFAELSAATERLIEESQAARERLDALAAAIGACPCCFGENLLCETCGGAGGPGSRLPQPQEFQRYVKPAVQRVQAALRHPQVRRPWPRGSPAIHTGGDTPESVGARS